MIRPNFNLVYFVDLHITYDNVAGVTIFNIQHGVELLVGQWLQPARDPVSHLRQSDRVHDKDVQYSNHSKQYSSEILMNNKILNHKTSILYCTPLVIYDFSSFSAYQRYFYATTFIR